MYLQGSSTLNIDAKGRLTIPAKHRDALFPDGETQAMLSINLQDSTLALYPMPRWNAVVEALDAKTTRAKAFVTMRNQLISNAEAVELDASGRIQVNKQLRTYAKLVKSVVVAGVGASIQIMTEDMWTAQQAAIQAIDEEEMEALLEGIPL